MEEAEQTLPDSTEPETKTLERLDVLEAALYVAGRPLDLKTLASTINTRSKNVARKLVCLLKEKYDNRKTSLEILQLSDERFVMQLKTQYSPMVQRLAVRPLLTTGPLKTLSYIAFRQPISQKQVINVRGNHAYGHLKQLEELSLIKRERAGRSKTIRTTQFFADYFGLNNELRSMKRQLKKVFGFNMSDLSKKES